ncbi:MAG: flagellin [Nitriliruptoraceae bacterium]
MRVTSEVMISRSLDRLNNRLKAYERTQSELATGRRILKPSDDPAGSRRAISLRASMKTHERHLANASDAVGWLDAADAQLQSGLERLGRVRELTVRGSTSSSMNEREALASEIEQINEELLGIANATHLDRPLFGGYSDGLAVERTGPGAYGFHGSGEAVTRRVSDTELVRVNTTAGEWLGEGGPDGDLLSQLDGLVADLRDPTKSAGDIGSYLDSLKAAQDVMASSLADIGGAANRVESARSRAEAQLLTVRTELSNVQDVDVAEGVMDLQVQQVAYEATLQALAKALPPSLGAFLR